MVRTSRLVLVQRKNFYFWVLASDNWTFSPSDYGHPREYAAQLTFPHFLQLLRLTRRTSREHY
jgi:hypothetical protein